MKFRFLKEEYLMEMANLRGKDIKLENVNFSIYFSPKGWEHSIRIKVLWNRENMRSGNFDGILKLHGDYEYIQSSTADKIPNQENIDSLRNFAKKYKVLFAGVWEKKIDPNDVEDYFKGRMQFEDLLKTIDENIFDNVKDLKELEKIVRENNLWNMND